MAINAKFVDLFTGVSSTGAQTPVELDEGEYYGWDWLAVLHGSAGTVLDASVELLTPTSSVYVALYDFELTTTAGARWITIPPGATIRGNVTALTGWTDVGLRMYNMSRRP